MSSAVMVHEGRFHVVVVDPDPLWIDGVAEQRILVSLDDRATAHRVARLLECVEEAVHLVLVNVTDLGLLHAVADGAEPLSALDVAHDLVAVRPSGVQDWTGEEPLRLEDDLRATGLPDAACEDVRTALRTAVGHLVDLASDPTSDLAGLRAASEVVRRRVAARPLPDDDPVRLRPNLRDLLLECQRCWCDFLVRPDCTPQPGAERFGAPATVGVEWKDVGVTLFEPDDPDDVDDCPCHGEDVSLPWGAYDGWLLAEVASLLASTGGGADAWLTRGPELAVALSESRRLVVRRDLVGDWEHVVQDGPRGSASWQSSSPELAGQPLVPQGSGAAAFAAAVVDVLARSGA